MKYVASVQMGQSFRTRLDVVMSGGVAVIQMKDLTDQNRVSCAELVRIDIEKPKAHHLMKRNDLVFRSRGLVTNSAIVDDDPGDAVLAAPLFRIRLTESRIMPEYLNWFISQAPAQSFLASHAKGTAQKMISKDVLEDLEVLVPPLERQRKIIEMAALVEEEQKLMRKLAEKRKQYIFRTLMQMAEGEPNR